MQYNDTHLSFLKEKIMDIKVALFKSEINSELQLPNNIVHTLKVDGDGNIYFFTSCNGFYAEQIDQSFYAYLDYHKKTDTRIRVSGIATLVKEQTEVELTQTETLQVNSLVLVKMKIMQAEYFDRSQQPHISFAQKVKSTFSHWFFPSSEHHYNFS